MHSPPLWPSGKASASRPADLGSIHDFVVEIFLGRVMLMTLNIGTPVATPSGAWCYRISAGTGWPGVSLLCPGET